MQWVRTNRRFGAWCALAAIGLQIILSFGHAHRTVGLRPVGLLEAGAVYAQAAVERTDPTSKAPALALEYCAICAVIKMGAALVPPEAPASGIPVIAGRAQFSPRAEAAAWTLAHRLFQARAPPPV